MYVFVLSSSINGLCHSVGYKNFENTATNIRALALITGGEGLHNNHHGYPRSPKFSFRASEIDPAWPLIKLLIALKLAKPYKTIDEVARLGSNSAARSSEFSACVPPPTAAAPAPPAPPPSAACRRSRGGSLIVAAVLRLGSGAPPRR